MKTRAWHRTIASWLLFPVVLSCTYSNASIEWYFIGLAVYLCIAITVTAGYHRLFNHNSYTCPPLWHYIFGLVGVASLNSSPVEWSAAHTAHHKFSDTVRDPYDSSFRHFLRLRDRTDITPTKNEVRMLKKSYHKFLMEQSLSISLIVGIVMLLCGSNVFLFGFALPVTGYLVTSGLQTIFAHSKTGPRNLKILEFIMPMAGEWLHLYHHKNPGASQYSGGFDLGGYFIKIIKNSDKI